MRTGALRPQTLRNRPGTLPCPVTQGPHSSRAARAMPVLGFLSPAGAGLSAAHVPGPRSDPRSEEHTSELQSQSNLVCRLLLEKKKKNTVIDKHTDRKRSTSHA